MSSDGQKYFDSYIQRFETNNALDGDVKVRLKLKKTGLQYRSNDAKEDRKGSICGRSASEWASCEHSPCVDSSLRMVGTDSEDFDTGNGWDNKPDNSEEE